MTNLSEQLFGPSIVFQHDIDRAVEAGSKAADAVKAANGHGPRWEDELQDLENRLRYLPSTEQAEASLAELESSVAAQVKEHEAAIKDARAQLKTPHLGALAETHVRQKIAKVEERLSDFRARARCPLAQAKALVETAKEWNPKRKRYEELKKRKQAIDKALKD